MDNEVKKLYSALINKGYTTKNLGDEQTFMSKMQDADNRKQLYDWVNARGDFRIGSYEDYEKRLTTPPAPKAEDINPTGDKSGYTFTAEELGMPDNTYKAESTSVAKLPEIKPLEVQNVKMDSEKLKLQGEALGNLNKEKEMLEAQLAEVRRKASERRKAITSNAGAYQFGMAPVTGNVTSEVADIEMAKLGATENQLEQAIREVDRKISGEDAGFWQGVLDATVRNPGFYTMGMSDMSDARAMLDLSENGINSETDLALADATYENSALQEEADRGFMYRAGNMFGHSIPFMVQMAASGGGTGISKLGGKAAQRFAKETLKHKILRATGVVADDLLESAFIANTAGAGTTQTNILQRKAGQLRKDAQDGYYFEGKNGWLEAAAKGEMSSILEQYTEKLGNHLDGKLSITKGLDKIGAKKISTALAAAKKSDIGKAVNTVLTQFGINGVLPEVMEEEANIVLNSIFVGDNKLSNLFDIQTQLDIVGGMFLTVGTMRAIPGAIGSVGYIRNQRKLNAADKEAEAVYGEKWAEMRERLNDASNEEVADVCNSMIGSGDDQALLDYYKSMMVMRGYNIGTTKREDNIPGAEQSYQEGYEAADEKKGAVKQAYDMERERVLNTFGEEVVQKLDDDPIGALMEMNEVDRQEAIAYVNARTAYEGMIDRISDDIDERIKASDKEIDSHKNKQDGAIHPAVMRGVKGVAPKRVYIVGGNVATFEDGTIDKANSSSTIIVRDAETGKASTASADDLESLDAVIDTEAEKKSVAEQIANEYAGQQAVIIEAESGKLTYNSNDGVHTVEILGENGDVFTILDNGVERIATREWVDELKAQNGVVSPVEDQIGANTGKVVESSPTGEAATPVVEAPKTALEQIPRNEKNIPLYEQVDSELAWDGVVEEAGGNEETAMVAVNSMVEDKKKALAAAEKAKARAGATITEKIAAENERIANIEKAKADLAKWEEIAGVKAKRAAAQAENVAVPVVEETQAPVVESAPVEETPQATNEMQEADLENAEKGEKGQKAVEQAEGGKQSVTDEVLAMANKTQQARFADHAKSIAEKLGVEVTVHNDESTVTNRDAMKAIAEGGEVKGWYNPTTGEIALFLPAMESMRDVESTILHEAVSHYGIKHFLGKEDFDKFLDGVWDMMPAGTRAYFLQYVGADMKNPSQEKMRQAADEYVAHIAEKMDLNELEKSVWQRFIDYVMDVLRKAGFKNLKQRDVEAVIRASYANLRQNSLPSVDKSTAPLGQGSSLAAEEDIRFREGQEEETMSFDEIKTAPLTFEEKITQGVLTASALNKKNLDLRQQALREFGRDLTRLLTLMKEQRAYDKSTVDLLVKLSRLYFENAQVLDKMSAYNVKRIMGVLNNAIGKRNITDDANRLLGILMDAHTKELNNLLDTFVKTRATKMNTAGVEIIGSLDKHGQMVLATYKAALEYDANKIDAELLKAENELTDESKVVREEAASRLEGLLLAKEYKDEIKSRREEIAELEREIKDKARQAREGALDRSAYREFKRATQEAITRSNLELIGAYHALIQKMSTGIGAASARAREFMKKQLEHVQEIQHDANSDMEGKSADTQGEIPDNWNNSIARIVMGPMVTFQGILKKLGEKSVDGKGYLYNRFMKQITNAGHRLWKKKVGNLLSLNGKLSEIFGREMQYNDLYAIDKRGKSMTITYVENGGPKEIELSQGQMMYLYMINKMSDGAMKLRGMGITESAMLQIEGALMPELKTFADWVQATFLNEKRTEYNEVHERMFGSAMANIEDYFPIKINTKSLTKEEDVALKNVEDKPSTVTGSIIKRTRNAAPVDLSANAIDVLMEHLDKMEQWAAFAETNRDLNSLLSYKRFRNQVLNLKTRRFGSGKKLWDNFRDVCALASRNYTPKTSDVDRAVTNITKGVTASKISFRLFTAMKQLLSAPAFYTETDVKELYKAYKSPKESWDWAIENLPGFAERWQSRQSGNERLKTTDADWDIWKNKYIKGALRAGMLPNAWVDAVVVSTGARAVYLTKLKQFMAAGYEADAAEAKALQAAAEAYNESQQSNEGAYLSAMQVDRTVISTILTVFKNSNFGYTRKTAQSVANLAKHLKKGNKAQSIEFMAKQMMREGLTEEQARKYADKLWKESILRDSANVAMFGFLLNALWALGPELIYLFGGDDEEEKEKSWNNVVMGGLLSPVAGLGGGDFVSDVVTAAIDGRWENIELPGLPAFGDMENIYSLMEYDPVRGATELLNMLVSAGVGVNPKTFADMYAAIASTDFANPEELGLFVLKFVNAPQGQIDRLMADKALENGGDNLAAVAAEYMEYKKQYNTPLLGGLYSDEGERKAYERYAKRFKRQVNDRLGNVAEDDTAFAMYYEDASPELRSLLTGLREKYIEGDKEPLEPKAVADIAFETLYGKKELNTEYLKLATPDDVDALIELKQKWSELRKFKETLDALPPEQKGEFYDANADALEKYSYLDKALREISKLQKAMTLNKEAGQEILDGIRSIADAVSAEITSTGNN